MSGFDMPVNPEVLGLIKKMSRTRYGRDINVVNADIESRADLDKPTTAPLEAPVSFPPMNF
jgi:hypothetical protein